MFVPEREYYIPETFLKKLLETYYRKELMEGKVTNEDKVEDYISTELTYLRERRAYKD